MIYTPLWEHIFKFNHKKSLYAPVLLTLHPLQPYTCIGDFWILPNIHLCCWLFTPLAPLVPVCCWYFTPSTFKVEKQLYCRLNPQHPTPFFALHPTHLTPVLLMIHPTNIEPPNFKQLKMLSICNHWAVVYSLTTPPTQIAISDMGGAAGGHPPVLKSLIRR